MFVELLLVMGMLVVGVVSLLAYWIWKLQEVFKTFENLGLPGPPPNFLLGNFLQMMKMGLGNAFTEWGKKYGKCYGVFLPREPVMVVSDPEILRDLMVKKFACFPNRPIQKITDYKPWSDGMSKLKNDHWRHVRKQLSPSFTSEKLKRMIPAIDRVVDNLDKFIKEKAETGEAVEMKYVAGCFAMDTMAGAGFGMHVDSLTNPDDPFNVQGLEVSRENIWVLYVLLMFPWMAPILHRLGLTFVPMKPIQFFLDIIDIALKDRREDHKRHSDILQLMVNAENKEGSDGAVDVEIDYFAELTTSSHWTRKGLTEEEIKANGMVFFLAGYNTTSDVLSFTFFHLAANPEALKKAQDEVDQKLGKNRVRYDTSADLTYLEMCLNESLRLHPAGFVLDREALEDTELGGYPLKKGTRVIIPVYSLHRDPDHWPEPDKFIPERHSPEGKASRHPFTFMPFGQGPRSCIGLRMAQIQIRMTLATVLQHYTPVLCDKSVYPPVLITAQIRMIAKDGLWLKFQPRE